MEGLPKHESWTDCMKLFNKAASTRKSKAQVARAQHGKAEKAKKVMEAMPLKETKPQFINPGVTAAGLRKDAKQADAHKHRAVSGLLLSGAIHAARCRRAATRTISPTATSAPGALLSLRRIRRCTGLRGGLTLPTARAHRATTHRVATRAVSRAHTQGCRAPRDAGHSPGLWAGLSRRRSTGQSLASPT